MQISQPTDIAGIWMNKNGGHLSFHDPRPVPASSFFPPSPCPHSCPIHLPTSTGQSARGHVGCLGAPRTSWAVVHGAVTWSSWVGEGLQAGSLELPGCGGAVLGADPICLQREGEGNKRLTCNQTGCLTVKPGRGSRTGPGVRGIGEVS